MNALVSTLILLAGLTQVSSAVSSDAAPASFVPRDAQEQDAILHQITLQQNLVGDAALPDAGHDNVLVIPTPDLPAESAANLTEDMTVMCRLFDKAVPPTRTTVSSGYGGGAYGDRGDVFRFAYGTRSQKTQGLYLDGYGALFFIHVDYPLVPTEAPEPTPVKPRESPDTVWSQTIKEMSGQPGEGPQTGPAYDPQRVDNLKKTLIATVGHAWNIRTRRPQDVITLVVGAWDSGRMSVSLQGRRAPAGSDAPNTAPVPPGSSQPSTARAPKAALLVLRVTKADVDALGKGQFTAAQFAEKVQSLWAPLEQGTPETVTLPARIGVSTGSSSTGVK